MVRVEQGADFQTRWRFQATLDGRLPTTPVCGGSGVRKVCERIYLGPAGAGEDCALPGIAAAVYQRKCLALVVSFTLLWA